MSQRPSLHGRTPSTNLGAATAYRPHEGKVAIVTGASRGIGAAVARLLASRGANIVLNYTSESSAQKTADLAKEPESTHGIKTVIVQADMGSIVGPAHVVTTAKNHFSHPKTGKFQIDIIINNAGVSSNYKLADLSAEDHAKDFEFQYMINVRGPLLLVKAAMDFLPNDRSGRIVNLSSVSATIGLPTQSVYGGTKAAVDAMTRCRAREFSERATVNAVNPGPVLTDMYGGAAESVEAVLGPYIKHTPLAKPRPEVDGPEQAKRFDEAGGRPAYDHEIAGLIGMLCSADSSWCTGSVVCANGGMVFSQ